jgi:hypoxanthine phosphoribosyltransferase
VNKQSASVTGSSRCELISWDHFYELARKLSRALYTASFQPETVVAISRGGCMPARVICDYLDVFDLDFIKIEHYHGVCKENTAILRYPLSANISGKRVLLIDDVSDTGESFDLAIKHLRENGEPAELKTAALHHKTVSGYIPDYYAEIVHEWRWIIYPWAIMEDLRSILENMETPAVTIEDFSRHLEQQHLLVVPKQTLEDLFSLSI